MSVKKDFYNHITQVFADGHIQLARVNNQIAEVEWQMKKQGISDLEYYELKGKRRELIAQEKDIKNKMQRKIADKAASTREQITREYSSAKLDVNSINADAKLFDTGMKLSVDDVKTIMRRNADNLTMLNLSVKYLEREHSLDYSAMSSIENEFPVLKKYNGDINSVDYADHICKMILNSYPAVEYAPKTKEQIALKQEASPMPPMFYTKYIAENSEIHKSLCD